jgi:hypothetical protein
MFTLMITGFDADPQTVTDLIGLEPSSIAIKGQTSKSGREHRSNGWWFEAHQERLGDGAGHAQAISKIVAHLRGREEAFQRLKQEVRPDQVTLYGALYFNPERQCGLWLDASDMEVLAACGVDWGLDLIAQD